MPFLKSTLEFMRGSRGGQGSAPPILEFMRGSRGGQGSAPLLKNHKNIYRVSLRNTGLECLKITIFSLKLPFNIKPPSAHQRNAIQKAFRWRADDGLLFYVIWILINKIVWQNCLDPRLSLYEFCRLEFNKFVELKIKDLFLFHFCAV